MAADGDRKPSREELAKALARGDRAPRPEAPARDRKPTRSEIAAASGAQTRPEPGAINRDIHTVVLDKYAVATVTEEPGWLVWVFRDKVEVQITEGGELTFVATKDMGSLTDFLVDGSTMAVAGDMVATSMVSSNGHSVVTYGDKTIVTLGKARAGKTHIVRMGDVEYKMQGGRYYINGKEVDVPPAPEPVPEPEEPDGPVKSKVWYIRAASLGTVRLQNNAQVHWRAQFRTDKATKLRLSEFAILRCLVARFEPCDLSIHTSNNSQVDLGNLCFAALEIEAAQYSTIKRFQVTEHASIRANDNATVKGEALNSCLVSERARGYARIDV